MAYSAATPTLLQTVGHMRRGIFSVSLYRARHLSRMAVLGTLIDKSGKGAFPRPKDPTQDV